MCTDGRANRGVGNLDGEQFPIAGEIQAGAYCLGRGE